MKKIILFYIAMLSVVSSVFFSNRNIVNAANTTFPYAVVDVSKNEVVPGETFTVTLTVKANGNGEMWETVVYNLYFSNFEQLSFGDPIIVGSIFSTYENNSYLSTDYECVSFQTYVKTTTVSTDNDFVFSIDVTVPENATFDEISLYRVRDDDTSCCIDGYYYEEYWEEFVSDDDLIVSVNVPSDVTKLEEVEVDGVKYNSTSSPTLSTILSDGLNVSAETESITFKPKAAEGGTVNSVSSTGNVTNNGDGTYTVKLGDSGSETIITSNITAQNKVNTGNVDLVIKRDKYDYSDLDGLEITLPSDVEGNHSLTPGFNKDVNDYVLSLPEGADSLDVDLNLDTAKGVTAKINGEDAVDGTNSVPLVDGNGDPLDSVIIEVTAQDGTTTTYTIDLERKSDNVNLASLKAYILNGNTRGNEIPLTNYVGSIGFADATGFEVEATLEDTKGTIDIGDPVEFGATSYDATTKTITVTVTSESGIVKEYQVAVTRTKANDDLSFNLVVTGKVTSTVYTKSSQSTDTYWIYELPGSEEKAVISISGLAATTSATGAGEYEIYENVANEHGVTITPQYASKAKTITISIRRSKEVYNSVDTLELLTEENGITFVDKDGNSLVFDKSTDTYTFYVPYTTTSLFIVATTKNKATLTGIGVFTLSNTGDTVNTKEVCATSEAGFAGQKYKINVYRTAADTSTELESLVIAGQTIDLKDGAIDLGELLLPRETESVLVEAILPEDSKATIVSGNGTVSVTPGSSTTIKIIVDPEDPTLPNTEYVVKVVCKETENTITNIELNGIEYVTGTNEYSFSSNPNGTVNVIYASSTVSFNIETDGDYVKLYVNGSTYSNNDSKALSVNDNTFTVYAVSEYGEKGTEYTIIINRTAPDTNTELESLVIAGQTIDLKDGATDLGELLLPRETESVLVEAILPEDSKATIVSGNGTVSVTPGSSTNIKIIVDPEDPTLPNAEYVVTVVCKETENTITNIELNDIEYVTNTDEYDFATTPNTTVYVTYATSNVTFNVTNSGDHSTIYVNDTPYTNGDLKSLSVNDNTFRIYAVSEYGEKGTEYTIIINRKKADTNTELESLVIAGQTIDLKGGATGNLGELLLPRDTTSVEVVATLPEGSKATIISGTGTQSVNSGGTKDIPVIIKPEDSSLPNAEYIVTVVCKETENTITKIELNDIVYVEGTNGYDFATAPNGNVKVVFTSSKVSFNILTDGEHCQVYVNGDVYNGLAKDLNVGDNTFTIYAQSEYGENGIDYTITINRAQPDKSAALDKFKINGQELDLSKGPNLGKIYLPRDTGSVNVEASLPEDSSATLTGNGVYTITPGDSEEITVTVTPQDTSIAPVEYTVVVVCQETENTITNIEVNGVEYVTDTDEYDFSTTPNTTIYVTHVSNKVSFVISKTGEHSKIFVNGIEYTGSAKDLNVGDNTFTIYSESEVQQKDDENTHGTEYTIIINRKAADENNSLESLTVAGQVIDLNQTPLDDIYGTIYQPHETTTVEVIAKLPEGSLATIGTIDNSVAPGQKNTIIVPVISEADAIKNYKVVVICKETNNKIDNIEIKGIEYVAGTDEYDFSTTPNTTVYVTYATSRISFSITLNGQHSTVFVNGKQYIDKDFDLDYQDVNTFVICAVSEAGVNGTEYTIIIDRAAPDSDATLSSLEFLINGVNRINEEFESSTYSYTVDIPENETATKGTIVATTTSSVAKIVSGTGEITLPSISQTYYIVVEAQDDSKITYEILVIKEGSQLDTNNKITDIDVLDGSTNYMVDTQEFKADKTEYNITLPWNVSSVSIDVTPEKDTATIIGAGIKSLEQGETKTYEVYAKAQNGSIGTTRYYITISRDEADHDAYLTSLTVGNTTIDLIDGTYIYDIRVERSVTDIEIKAIPCENATVSGAGNKNLSVGKNGYEVEVTAQDGVTKQIYYVNIFRNEDENKIKNITVSNSNYVFDENVTTPEKIVIPYSKKVVTITVETDALYPKTINGAGTTDFEPGIHTIEIYVVSDFGTKGTKYTLTIEILDSSNDNYLKEFEVQIKGENVIEYDYNDLVLREKTLFTIEDVADDVLDVYIKAVKNNDNATVTGVGNRSLSNFDPDKHSCTLTVTVTAENGDVREIHLVFVRDSLNLDDNNDITDIVIKGSDGVTYFNSYKKEDVQYQVEVPYEVVSITIEVITPLGVNSTLTGNTLYTFGDKYILNPIVYATSHSDIKGTEYKFTITRQEPNSDASLEWIKINGSIITGFDSQKTEYSFLVNNAVDEIHLLSKALVSSSTVEVQMGGNVVTESILPLEAGKNNQITIISTAQDGSKKAYTLNVTRASADGVLSDLYLEGVNFHDKDDRSIVVNYNPEVNEYYATVSYAVSSVNVCASTSDSTLTVRGTGLINLSVGSQELQVSAIPTIGNIGVYTITIIRKAEANSITDVKDFNIAEIEGFKDVFTNDVDIYDESYNLTVGPEVTKLTLDLVFDTAQYEDEPTVEVTQNELKFGNNIVYVKVTATDKTTTRLIALHVKRLSVTVLSAAIEEIEAFAEEFSNDINEYSYAVDNSVKSLTFDIKLKEECGSYAISNTDLTEGKVNVITITISVGDEVCKVITLNVLRTTANNTSTLPIGLIIAVAIASTAILVTSYFMCKKRKQRRG